MAEKFGEIFGEPKLVDNSAHRAIAETVADACECGDGQPGSWDPDAEMREADNLELLVSMLREFADIATHFKLQILQHMNSKDLLRAEFQYMLTQLIPMSPEYKADAIGGMTLTYEELPAEAKQAQRSAVAAKLERDPFGPEVEQVLKQLRMAQTFETIGDIDDDAERATAASIILNLLLQRLAPMTKGMSAEPDKPKSKIIIPGEFGGK